MAKREPDLQAKADQILQEIRIVLPGTQALLGFQFVTFFNPVFQALPNNFKYLHFATLLLTMICTIFLIAPVAFQQLGQNGKVTESFIKFTRTMLSMAMWLLLIALSGDVFLAGKIINLPTLTAAGVSIFIFLLGFYIWYIYVSYKGKVQ